MTLIPRTLLARTFLLIATLLVLSTAAWYFIFRTYEREPQVNQVARLVVSVVNLTRTALVAAQPGKRTALLEELEELEGIQLYPFDSAQTITPVDDAPILRKIQDAVRLELGEETRFAEAVGGVSGFWISFSMEGDDYWVVLPADRIPQDRTLQWLGWGLLALLLSLAGAYLIVSRVTRPLKLLAAAARQIGLGKRPLPVIETGPDELRNVARTFNEMNQDLARLDEDRALILAGVSHDLRTPLARMRLAVEMMASDADLKSGMTLDIDDMDRIIGQFLDFARTEDSETLLPTDLAALARELVSGYRERGRVIDIEAAPTPMIRVRPLATRRMITNLIDNAFRYAGEGITVRTYATDETVSLEVLDRGPGIPESEVERLKQPFQRLESARTGQGGSGLGLAIVERVARMHHGQFDLLPRDGGGLVARLRLPTDRGSYAGRRS
jgi:two-component system, OmpR family, osmolarity sensor histidine kinase EnvZ